MPSPVSPGPYEVLGVPVTASEDELRRAFRRRLRQTHPDAGGSAAEFHAVQRAWELIGSAEARAAYDRGAEPGRPERTWAPAPPRPRTDSRPPARSYGHPGGWYRERYLALLAEWVGRGVRIDDPYDPALVRSAPREVRYLLAAAVAEEESARRLATLGIGFTLWHDAATDAGKLDHVVLGPTGLWAVQSEDWGAPVRIRRGELIGDTLAPGEKPVHEVAQRARLIARSAKARFSAIVVVVPDGHIDGVQRLGSMRGAATLVAERSRLVDLLRTGIPDVGVGGTDLFELRSRLQAGVRLLE